MPIEALARRLLGLLVEPRVRGLDVDGSDRIRVHREIVARKPLLREVFTEVYSHCHELDLHLLSGEGARVEVGAGSSFMADVLPGVRSSDVGFERHLALAADAQRLPFRDETLRAVYGINCFHHFPEPDRFFSELTRALVPGGGAVLVDPYFGPVARWFYSRLFEQEHFNPAQGSWSADPGALTTMRGANQALSYIVFVRDRELLLRGHPDLEVVHQAPLGNALRYLLSGGVNFRSLWPAAGAGILRRLEAPWALGRPAFALHHAIVVRKRLAGTPRQVRPDRAP